MKQSIPSPQGIRIRRLLTLLISLTVIATALLIPEKTAAVNKTWIGSGNWSDPNNWSPVGVPQSGDAVIFNGTSTNNATIDAAGPQGVNISVFTISINSGYSGTITVADAVNISVSHITINSGTFNVPPTSSGTLTVVENFTLNGGTFNHAGGTVVFVGTNSQILLTPSTVNFNNLTVNKVDGHNITIADPSKTVRIINTLTLTEGKISANSNSMFKAENAVNIASGFGNQSGGGSAVLLIRDEQDGINTRTILLPPGASLPSITLDDPDVTLSPSGPGTVAAQNFILHRGTVALGATNFDVGFVSGSGDANYTQTGGSFSIGSGNFTTQQFGLFQLSGPAMTTFTATSGNLNLFRSNCTFSGGVLTTPSGVTTIGANFNYNFTQSGGIFNGNGTVEINGRFTLSNGTFNATPGTTSFGFVFDHQSGTFNHGGASSTIVLDGEHPAYSIFAPGAQGTETFHNLTVNLLNGQLSLNDDTWVINGTLRLINGTVISTGPGKFQSQGDVVIESTADGGSANITFTGSANQTYTNNGGANLTGTWTINKLSGALILATNLNVGTSVLNLTDGTINTSLVSAPTTADKEGAPNGPAVVANMLDTQGSTVNIGATFDGGTATIAFTGSGVRTVTMPAGVVMPNVLLNAANATLTTSGAGTVTMSNLDVQAGTANLSAITADINGAFAQTGGTFTAPTGNLLLAGNLTHTAGGTFNANNGTVIFDGPTAQTVDVNGTETFATLTLNKTGTNNNDVLNIAAGDTLIAANTLDLQNGEIWGGTIQVPSAMTVAVTFADGVTYGGTGTIAITGATARTITIPTLTRLPNIIFNAPNVTLSGSGIAAQSVRTRDFTQQAGTISLNVNLIVRDFILTGGTFNAPAVLRLEGNFIHTAGGTFNHNNGEVSQFANNSVIDVNGTAIFFRLSFVISPATVDLSGDTLIVLDSLNLANTTNNGFIEAQKDVILVAVDGGGNGTVNVVGSATRTITVPGGTSLPNFVLNAPNVTMTGGTASMSFATFRSLNLQAGAIQPGDVPWRFSQFYTQSGGTFASGNKDIDVDGDFTITGDTASFTTSQTNTFFGGNFTDATAAGFNGTPGTVTFDGSSTQNIEVGEFELFTVLTIAPADGVALNITSGQFLRAESLTLVNGQVNTGIIQSTDSLTVASGFDGGTANVTIFSATYTNNGGINPTGTWTLSGGFLASELDLSNSTGALVLSGGITTLTHTLNAGERTITRTSGFVNGTLQRSFSTTGTRTFDIGASTYLPVTVDVTALGVTPSSLKIRTTTGTNPSLDPLTSLNRYWTITETGDLTATLTFRYVDGDINGNESFYRIFRVTGGVPANFPNNCPGTPCVDTTANTATIAGVSQFSDWGLGEPGTPTAVDLVQFNAVADDKGTMLEWQTGTEADNLGFNLYREEGGKRTLINPQLIAGSALRADSTLRSGDAYRWWDNGAVPTAFYWLEDIDLKGQSAWHGPYYTKHSDEKTPPDSNATLLSEVAARALQQDSSRPVERRAVSTHNPNAVAVQTNTQAVLPAGAAAKIQIKREGWYRITQPELASIGFNTRTDPRSLQLFVDGLEAPILVLGEEDGRFDAQDSLEFYGLALDSPYTDARTYWLSVGSSPGIRVKQVISQSESTTSQSFTATVERRDRTIYFSALRNGDRENFFGAVLAGSPVDQLLTLSHLSSDSREAALEVGLQGVTMQQHSVDVEINGVHAGLLRFQEQLPGIGRFNLPSSVLRDGANTVRFTPIGGPGDVSLVDFIRISYQRSYIADNNFLRLTAPGSAQVSIDGFTSPTIRVVDVTDSNSLHEVVGVVEKGRAGYAVRFTASQGGERSLIAFTAEGRPARLWLDQPSKLTDNPADFIIVTGSGLADSLETLAGLRRTQGLSVAVVDIEDIYDEFNFGERSPDAVRDYLSYAISNWKKKPQFVLLGGDASVDPKNYLGFGQMDLVPTKLVDTGFMETASDDWFADFDDDGVADMAIGRLPARTADEIAVMIKKILAYTEASPVASALLVADQNDSFDFEQASAELRGLLPSSFAVEEIKRAQMDAKTAKARLFEALERGQQVVNYVGHGSALLWRGNLLMASEARELSNSQLPVFVMMSCLNGYFQDVVVDSLGEALLKAEHGGAVAVWASSGLTYPQGQAQMNRAFYEALFAANGDGFAKKAGSLLTLGEAVQQAKAAISDTDVRRTWILLGDPTLRLK